VLPYVRENNLSVFAYGPLCRGLLTGTMRPDSKFTGDDLRQSDPKFQLPVFEQYLNAVQKLDDLAQERYGKHVMDLAVRWVLDQPGITAALWGARYPAELDAVAGTLDWKLDADTLTTIDQIVRRAIRKPIGPEFMAPPTSTTIAA